MPVAKNSWHQITSLKVPSYITRAGKDLARLQPPAGTRSARCWKAEMNWHISERKWCRCLGEWTRRNHLKQIKEEIERKFNDLINTEILICILDPFHVQPRDVAVYIQESLIIWQTRAHKLQKAFWIKTNRSQYCLRLGNNPDYFQHFFHLIQGGFSNAVSLTKCRNSLCFAARRNFRLLLLSFKPDIKKRAMLKLESRKT